MIDKEKGMVYLSADDLHAAALIIGGDDAGMDDDTRLRLVAALTIARVCGAVTLRRV